MIHLTKEAAQQVLDALKIGSAAASLEATHFHESMKGYRKNRHEAIDAEVINVEAAIATLQTAIDAVERDDLMIWKVRALQAEAVIEKFMKPEQEPIGWLKEHKMIVGIKHTFTDVKAHVDDWARSGVILKPVFTAPQAPKARDLSDTEIRKLQSQYPTDNDPMQFARAIEAIIRATAT